MTKSGWFFFASSCIFGLLINLSAEKYVDAGWLSVLTEERARAWLEALSGWAALLAAGPTIYYLKKQVDDAERHQRATFEIQLRRDTILAKSVTRFADDATFMLRDATGNFWEVSSHTELYKRVLDVLRGETIEAFEREIAVPKVMRGKIVAQIVDEGIHGDMEKAEAAPTFIDGFFAQIREQAQDFLQDVGDKTGR